MRIINFLKIGKDYILKRKETHEEFTYRVHADSLILNKEFQKLEQMFSSGYEPNYKQQDLITKEIHNRLFKEKTSVRSEEHVNTFALLNCFLKHPSFKDFQHYSTPFFEEKFSGLKIIMGFDNTFFFKLGINAFNPSKVDPGKSSFEEKLYLKKGLEVIELVLNEFNQNNKKRMIKQLLTSIPVELHPYIYNRNPKLPFFKKEEYDFHLSIHNSYEYILKKRSETKEILESQKNRLENLEKALANYEKFNINYKLNNKVKKTSIELSHEDILDSLNQKNSQEIKKHQNINFSEFNFGSIYELSESTNEKLQKIQSLYTNLQPTNLNIEESHLLAKVPKTVFELLNNHEMTQDFLEDNENFLQTSLEQLLNTIVNIKNSFEESKIEMLSQNKKTKTHHK